MIRYVATLAAVRDLAAAERDFTAAVRAELRRGIASVFYDPHLTAMRAENSELLGDLAEDRMLAPYAERVRRAGVDSS